MANERNCTVCGKQYKYCPKCSQYKSMEKWHIEYCSDQCKNTYSIINKYAFKHIDKDQAKMLLEGNNITKKSSILPKWKEFVNEILMEEEKKIIKNVVEKESEKKIEKTATKTVSKKTTRKKKNIVNED